MITGKPEAIQDAIDDCIRDQSELGIALPDGIERMLQGQDLAGYIALRQAEARKSWLYQHGLTEDDVYGRHANRRPVDPEEGLWRWHLIPKGRIEFEDRWGTSEVRNPYYKGEHRRPKNTTVYPDGMTYLCGRSLFRVDGECPDELIALLDDNEEADVYGGYVNQ